MGTKAGTQWEQEPTSGTRMGTKWEQSGKRQECEQSGNKNPGPEREHRNKVGARTAKWDKNGNKAAKSRTWDKDVSKAEKLSGNKNRKVGQKWEQSRNEVGTRSTKWDKNGNKVGTKWEQREIKNPKMDKYGNKVGTKCAKVGQEWEQSGNKSPKVGTRMRMKWDK